MSNGKGNNLRACLECRELIHEPNRWVCARCQELDYDALITDPDDDNEPIGSCDECGTNLYADDEWDGLCNECYWLSKQ